MLSLFRNNSFYQYLQTIYKIFKLLVENESVIEEKIIWRLLQSDKEFGNVKKRMSILTSDVKITEIVIVVNIVIQQMGIAKERLATKMQS